MTSRTAVLLSLALGLGACGDDPSTAPPPPGAPTLQKVAGDSQHVLAGAPLPLPLLVRVVDSTGAGVAGVQISWTVPAGGASAVPGVVTTDATGHAQTSVTTGATAGPIRVQASGTGLNGSPVTFAANADGITLARELLIAPNYGIHDQFVRDGIAFLSTWNSGLQIYDVGGGGRGGSPQNPVLISSVVTGANGVSGGASVHNAWWYHAPGGAKRYVFVGQEGPAVGGIGIGSSGDIHVVDVSNMSLPAEVAYYHMSGLGAPRDSAGTHNFWVDEINQVLYAAYYNGGVVALDISGTLSGNLASREIARIRPGGLGGTYTWGVHLSGGSLYATDMLSGFWQLRLVGNAFQVLGGGNNVPERFGSDQWVAGGYAYSGTWGSRGGTAGNAVKVWQLDAVTGAPTLVDSIVTPNIGTVSDIEVSADGRLLVFSAEGGGGAGLHLYDLTVSRTRPRFITSFPVSSGLHTATIADLGGRRYVFASRNPANPALLILDVTAVSP